MRPLRVDGIGEGIASLPAEKTLDLVDRLRKLIGPTAVRRPRLPAPKAAS